MLTRTFKSRTAFYRLGQSVLAAAMLGALISDSHLQGQTEIVDPEIVRQDRLHSLFNSIRAAKSDIEKIKKSISEIENPPHEPKDIEHVLTALESQHKNAAGLLSDIVKNAPHMGTFDPKFCRDMQAYISSSDIDPDRLRELSNTHYLTDLINSYSTLDFNARRLLGKRDSPQWNSDLEELELKVSFFRHMVDMYKQQAKNREPEFKRLSAEALGLTKLFDWTFDGCQAAYLKAMLVKKSAITVTAP